MIPEREGVIYIFRESAEFPTEVKNVLAMFARDTRR
jgi:hypothetical protein